MEVAKVQINGVRAEVVEKSDITRGMVGAQVRMEYTDAIWEGLTKTVVFRAKSITKDVVDAGELVTIPPEVLMVAGWPLEVGVYGSNADGTLVIPTMWAGLGNVRCSATPCGDPSTNPALPVWAQLMAKIGDLDKLETETKESLVAALNEVLKNVDMETVTKIVEGYLAANPAPVQSVNGQTGKVDLTVSDIPGAMPWDPSEAVLGETLLAAEKTVTNLSGSPTETTGGFPDLTISDVYEGQKLAVYFDGVRYEVEVVNSDGMIAAGTLDPATGELLFMLVFGTARTAVGCSAGEHVASVYGINYRKLPQEYIPEPHRMEGFSLADITAARQKMSGGGRVMYGKNDLLSLFPNDAGASAAAWADGNGYRFYSEFAKTACPDIAADGQLIAAMFPAGGVAEGQHLEVACVSGDLVVFKGVELDAITNEEYAELLAALGEGDETE